MSRAAPRHVDAALPPTRTALTVLTVWSPRFAARWHSSDAAVPLDDHGRTLTAIQGVERFSERRPPPSAIEENR
jgi:hypothetical protein